MNLPAMTIRTLTLAAPGDRLTLELRLRSLLGAASLELRTLPPSAILCVRALRDPHLGRLLPKPSGMQAPAAWQVALQAQLEALSQQAARPSLGPVPPDAEAVVFMSQAELLFCLSRDWLKDSLHHAWWWQSLYPGGVQPQTVWLEAPQLLPALLHDLAVQRLAESFVERLEPRLVLTLLKDMLRCYGLAALLRLAETLPEPEGQSAPSTQRSRAEALPLAPGVASSLLPWVPEARAATPDAAGLLLGLGLMLKRAPSVVRQQNFAQTLEAFLQPAPVAAWQHPKGHLDALEGVAAEVMYENTLAPSRFAEASVETAREEAKAFRPVTSLFEAPQPLKPHPDVHLDALAVLPVGTSPEVVREDTLSLSRFAQETSAEVTREGAETCLPSTLLTRLAASPQALKLQRLVAPASSVPVTPYRAIATAYGGLFYLVNLALNLGLYADFSQPLKRGLELPLWDFLALLGEALVGPDLKQDALWVLLAELSGRDVGTAPGTGFEPSSVWRVPCDWLKAFPEPVACVYGLSEGRFRLLHPEGFCLWEEPAQQAGDPLQLAQQAYAELPWTFRRAKLPPSSHHPLERWLNWLVPFVEARLARALAVSAAAVGHSLCAQAAQIGLSADHIALSFALQTLPLEVRLSGLDRDPGWVPAAGRSIRFHFE